MVQELHEATSGNSCSRTRVPEAVTGMRAAVTEDSIRKWFTNTKEYLSTNEGCAFDDIMAEPRRVLNDDDSRSVPSLGRCLARKGWRNVYEVKRGNEKDTLTVLATFSTARDDCLPQTKAA